MKAELKANRLSNDEISRIQSRHAYHTVTGDVLTVTFNDGRKADYPVLSGKWTPMGCVRKATGCYILALYDRHIAFYSDGRVDEESVYS